MKKAILLDFYGTVVHEDDSIIPIICKEVAKAANIKVDPSVVGIEWWNRFSQMFQNSYGNTFRTQRELGLVSLEETIKTFESSAKALELCHFQWEHWRKPKIYEDSLPFLNLVDIPVYILSNIDTEDIENAIKYHNLQVDDIITSEIVKSYKPRPEMFRYALNKYNLQPNEVIHVGDSITSDISGANRLDISSVWINRLGKKPSEMIKPTYTLDNLIDVINILAKNSR